MMKKIGLLILLFLVTASNVTAARYQVVDLGTLDGTNSYAHDINDNGQITGYSGIIVNELTHHAFLYENGSMTGLGTLGGSYSEGLGINSIGQVVGRSVIPSTSVHAFLWQNGAMTDLGTLGGNDSTAFGINDSGKIVGYSVTGAPEENHACLWENGSMTDLGLIVGHDSSARDINNSGQIVGFARSVPGESYAFLLENGSVTNLGGYQARAFSINETGQVVGYYQNTSNESRAVLWENGSMSELGALGGGESKARSINDAAQVVGESWNEAGERRAFLWENGIMIDLNDSIDSSSGWILEEATGISNNGQIVGVGRINGEQHAFLLDTVECYPSVYLTTNGSAFTTGDNIIVSIDLYSPCSESLLLETKTWYKTPDGSEVSILDAHLVALFEFNTSYQMDLIEHTFSGSESPGIYEFGLRLLNQTTGKTVAEDLKQITYTP